MAGALDIKIASARLASASARSGVKRMKELMCGWEASAARSKYAVTSTGDSSLLWYSWCSCRIVQDNKKLYSSHCLGISISPFHD